LFRGDERRRYESRDTGPRFRRQRIFPTYIPMKPAGILHEELSHQIVGAAMKVLNTLKPGLDEKAYENALVIELRKRGLRTEQQKRFNVYYEGELVDTLVPDLLVEDQVVVDPKVTEDFTSTHVAQMTGYLAITQRRLALLLNFKHADLRWKRVVR
jgi:GxxExxY protein